MNSTIAKRHCSDNSRVSEFRQEENFSNFTFSLYFHLMTSQSQSEKGITELSETQNYAYWYTRFFPGTHDFR